MPLVKSKTQNENYLSYLVFELLMVATITFVAVGLIIFYMAGKSDSRSGEHKVESLFDNPAYFALLCLIPVTISVALLIRFRNRNYIVGFEFDHEKRHLLLRYRVLLSRSLEEITVSFDEFECMELKELKFMFNEAYRGTTILVKSDNLRLDFISNNFIWETQPREKRLFFEELKKIGTQ